MAETPYRPVGRGLSATLRRTTEIQSFIGTGFAAQDIQGGEGKPATGAAEAEKQERSGFWNQFEGH